MEREIAILLLIILVFSSSLVYVLSKAQKKTPETIENLSHTNVSLESIQKIAENILRNLPDVSILGEDYEIKEISKENVLGFPLYKIRGRIGDNILVFYLSNDLSYILFYSKTDSMVSISGTRINDFLMEMRKMVPKKTIKPKVYLFIMSYCPFGNQMENLIGPLIKEFSDRIVFEPVYIYSKISTINGTRWRSLHGPKELEEDLREKAIFKIYGVGKWVDFVLDTNKNCSLQNIETCWKEAAVRNKIDTNKVETYVKEHREELLENDYSLSNRYGVTASPTLIVNDVEYKFRRDREMIKRFICYSFLEKPDICG